MLENIVTRSLPSSAATAITSGRSAMACGVPLLPAATTTVTPAAYAKSSASSRSVCCTLENEQLSTVAPVRAAYAIARATALSSISPDGAIFAE